MTMKLQQMLYPYLAPAGETGGGAGDADFGNDHVSTDDEAAPPKVEAPKEESKAEEPKAEEPKDDSKDELTDEDRKQGKYVPRERLAEINRKARAKEEAYQSEIQSLRQSLEANKVDASVEQIDARIAELDNMYDNFMMEGEKEKAKTAKAELRRYETARSQMVSHAYSVQAQLAAIEQYRYDNALDALEQQYPELDEKADEFSSETTQEIADLMAYHQQKGFSKADALRKATTTILGPPKTKGAVTDPNALKAQRTTDARKKAAETIGKQPPDISKLGLDSDKLGGGKLAGKDLLKMSQDQFAKVDEDTLKSLRGDDFVGEAA